MTTQAPPGLPVGSATDTAASERGAASTGRVGGATARAGITASASIAADVDRGRPRIRWTHAWPIVLRPTGDARVHLVHGAGGPLGGDELRLDVQVGAAATLAVRSAGATLVQPGRSGEPARWDIGVAVDDDAVLDWAPEPTVVADGATFHTSLQLDLGTDARAVVREVVVLGRHGRVGGRYQGRLGITVGGAALLAHTTLLDGADPALRGPGGSAGARAVGTLLLAGVCDTAEVVAVGPAAVGPAAVGPAAVGPISTGPAAAGEDQRVRWAWTELDGPGRMLLAVGEPGAVIAVLDAAAARLSRA
ncbi:MAG TPA: urease accessory protein UreD [Pseudonocardia sp.]